jgi:16S rRNA (guanine(966)-N(2))-methyltransferase RsmD
LSNPRIISGTAKGMRLQSVPGKSTRPITDRVKEALFNIIGPDIIDASMLDLFGGTGSVGIEALSRGASFVRFIELNRKAVDILKSNIKLTKVDSKSEVVNMDAFAHLQRSPDRKFEYIYVAPPQYKEMWKQAMELIDNNPDWLTDDAWVIVQIHPIEDDAPMEFNNFTKFDERNYGSTRLIFYEVNEKE